MDSNLGRSNRFFSSPNVQTGSGAHSASCSMGILFFGGIKWAGHDIEKSSPFSSWVKNGRVPHLLFLYTFTALKGTTFPSLFIHMVDTNLALFLYEYFALQNSTTFGGLIFPSS